MLARFTHRIAALWSHRRSQVPVGLVTCALLGLVAAAPAPTLAQQGIAPLGRHRGSWTQIEVAPPLAYVTGDGSLIVLDVSDPMRPREIGRSAPVLYWPQDLAVAHGIAYVADADHGLRRFDLRRPSAPRELEAWAPGRVNLVATDGHRIYVVLVGESDSNDPHLHVLEAHGTAPPRALGKLRLPGRTFTLAVEDGQAVLTSGGNHLLLVDVADPARPQIRVDMVIPMSVGEEPGLWLREGRLLLAGDTEKPPGGYWPTLMELRVGPGRIDVVSGATLVDEPTSRWPPPDLEGVAVVGNRAIGLRREIVGGAGTFASDLIEADLGGGQARWLPAPRALPHVSHDLAVVDRTLLVAAGTGGLLSVDLDDPRSTPRGAVDGEGADVQDIALGDRLWAVGRLGRLHVADPEADAGSWLDVSPQKQNVYDVAASGGHAVALRADGRLSVFGPGEAEPSTHIGLSRGPRHVHIQGSLALVGGGGTLLQIVQLDHPAGPIRLAKSVEREVLGTGIGGPTAMGVADAHVGLALARTGQSEPSLQILSVEDARDPRIVGAFPLDENVDAMDGTDRHLFLGQRESGVRIVDLLDPTQPREIAVIEQPRHVAGVRVHDSVLYVAGGRKSGAGLWAYDIGHPEAPRLVARSRLPLNSTGSELLRGMAVRDGRLYVAAGRAGVLRFALVTPGPRAFEAYLPSLLLEGGP